MRILLHTLNYAPDQVGIAPYSTGTAEAFAAAGYEVRAIAGKPYYPAWRTDPAYARPLFHREHAHGVEILRLPHYVPAEPTSAKRLLHHASFALASLGPLLKAALGRNRPDIVLAVAPSLIAAPVALLAARISGAKFWLHVQDFEAEAMVATGLAGEGSMVARLAKGFETAMLRSADMVSSISPAMCRKVIDKGVAPARVAELRNWAEIDRIVPLAGPSPYAAEWGLEGRKIAFYSGNIARKQGIEIIVEAARLLRHRKDIAFVICGDGPERARLAELSADLPAVQLHPLQPAERMGELLALADLCLLPQIPEAADLLLPSKLANMLAAGKPVLATAAAGTGLAEEVGGVGVIVPPGDTAAFAAAIERLLDDPGQRAALGREARVRAIERWGRPALLDRFIEAARRLAA